MMNAVSVKSYVLPPPDRKEIFRYAGAGGDMGELDKIIDECLCDRGLAFSGNVCYCEPDVSVFGDHVDLGFTSVESKALAKNLKNCRRAVIFGATVGMEIDRRIARYSAVSPVKALVFQAIGAERIEALCDVFCQSIKNDLSDGEKLCPRFSPGYGDLSIEFQREIFSLLGCERRIGLTLNESLVMSPSKSVTAIVGIK